jgi:glycosyltransferase involved in cell wall biosynthesis
MPSRVENVFEVIASADVLLLTSREEGSPNCVLEAMAIGTPVVSTRTRGTAECVRHGETGWLAEVGDVEQLASAVTHIIAGRVRTAPVTSRAHRWVRDRHGIARGVQDWLDVYGVEPEVTVATGAGRGPGMQRPESQSSEVRSS